MRAVLIVLIFGCFFSVAAQPVIGPSVNEFKTPFEITHASVDRLGEFYLGGTGKLMRLDTEGRPAHQADLTGLAVPGLLECWNPLRIWYHDVNGAPHRAAIIDHSLSVSPDSVTIDPAIAIRPLMTAPAILNSNCWVLDMDFSVKYLNLTTNTLMLETGPLVDPGSDPGFLFMRAYQNLLFLLTRDRGILVMNMTGKVIRTLPAEGAMHFGVLGEDIYFTRKDTLVFVNLYSGEQSEIKIPAVDTTHAGIEHERSDRTPGRVTLVLANDERLVIASGTTVRIYRFTPPN